jgi:putative toxin-antitoxin system antitoxin component (TIGR02293 family)
MKQNYKKPPHPEDEPDPSESSVLKSPEAPYLINRVREGLLMVEFHSACEMLGLSEERLAALLGISRATLHRRKKTGHLDRMESDRLVRYARIFYRANAVFGSPDKARSWLTAPAIAFNHEIPLDFADTEMGAREVEALLGRIEHGVFS